MTKSNNINNAALLKTSGDAGVYPTPDWQRFGQHQWRESDLSEHLHQAMINIGDGIELCVEAGGNPNHPPLLMIMGLGSQMIFSRYWLVFQSTD